MFSQRKSFFKGKLFYVVLFALFAFGLWLNQAPIDHDNRDDVNTDSNYSASTNGALNQGGSGSDNIMDNIIGSGNTAAQGGIENSGPVFVPVEPENTGYYLVKEIDGIIKIFFYDDDGTESLIRETDIAFSLLSTTDQSLFQKGVIKHTPEELDELLQDFES